MSGFAISRLDSSSTRLILDLPSGKPDRRVFLENGGEDLRPRVLQPAQKGNSCQFYAMNRLRQRIGPLHGSDYVEAREIERICSYFYKERSLVYKDIHYVTPLVLERLTMEKTTSNARSITEVFALWKPVLEESSLSRGISYVEKFLAMEGEADVREFIRSEWARFNQESTDAFCQSLGTSLGAIYQESAREDMERLVAQQAFPSLEIKEKFKEMAIASLPSWEKVAEANYHTGLTANLAYVAAFRALGFKASKWKPHQLIGELKVSLEREGALIVGGWFGTKMYTKAPSSSKMIANRPIYSWRPCDRHPSSLIEKMGCHAIVIIGAEVEGDKGGFVYFIDPNDPSDPEDLLKQKIYKISYENLRNNLIDHSGRRSNIQLPPSNLGYAIFYPR